MPNQVLVRFVTPRPKGPPTPGRIEWLSETQAAALVRAGHAVYVDSTAIRAPETAMVEPPENAMRPRARVRGA